jgi:hypothetical protein
MRSAILKTIALPDTENSANFTTHDNAATKTLDVDTCFCHRFTRGTQRVQ